MSKKEKIIKMLNEGKTYQTIRLELGVAISTIAYHAKQIGKKAKGPVRGSYDWTEVQKLYDTGLCLIELHMQTGISKSSISHAVKMGRLKIDRMRKCKENSFVPNESIFIQNCPYTSNMIKNRIKKDSLLPYKCHIDSCTLSVENPVWNGEPIVLHLDHINGMNSDNRLCNLRWLCPNCHSQTSTYCGRNIKNVAANTGLEPVTR